MVSLQRWARPLAADRALVHRAARRLGHPASIPRAIMSRSPEALAFGSRRHFIPASLSLPLCGCLPLLPALRFGTISPITRWRSENSDHHRAGLPFGTRVRFRRVSQNRA